MHDNCETDSTWELMEALGGGGELLRELAGAVRRDNKAEAELLLDKIADALGPEAQEAVALGRYMPPPAKV